MLGQTYCEPTDKVLWRQVTTFGAWQIALALREHGNLKAIFAAAASLSAAHARVSRLFVELEWAIQLQRDYAHLRIQCLPGKIDV